MIDKIRIRDVSESDLEIFFQQQCDPVANQMAAFPSRDRASFFLHWHTKVLGDHSALKKTIIFEEQIIGNILCWKQDDKFLVGYWLGRQYWGKGLAAEALNQFLKTVTMRPLYAYVAAENKPSMRVLEKCGFTPLSYEKVFSKFHGHEIEEFFFVLQK